MKMRLFSLCDAPCHYAYAFRRYCHAIAITLTPPRYFAIIAFAPLRRHAIYYAIIVTADAADI